MKTTGRARWRSFLACAALAPLLASLLAAATASAAAAPPGAGGVFRLPEICRNPEIKYLELPLDRKNPSGPAFGLAYRVYESYGRELPAGTILWILGGPGQPAFARFAAAPPRPSSFRHVVFDIRGIECSRFPGQAGFGDAFSTEAIAADTVELVRFLGLKDYLLFGSSYGTVHAQVVSSLLSNDRANRPLRVVLEGTLSRAFALGGHEVFEGFARQWQASFWRLPEGIRAAFLTHGKLPLNLSRDEWGTSIMNALVYGSFPEFKDGSWVTTDLLGYILGVATAGAPEAQENVRAILKTINARGARGDEESFAYRRLTCRELSDSDNVRATLTEDGRLEAPGARGAFCGDLALDRPYRSSDHPSSIPTFYFQGSADPATPPWMAREKFERQGTPGDRYVSVVGAGHPALEQGLGDCWDELWTSLARRTVDLEGTLRTCRMRTEIETKPGRGAARAP